MLKSNHVPSSHFGSYASFEVAENMRKWCEVDKQVPCSIVEFNSNYYIVAA